MLRDRLNGVFRSVVSSAFNGDKKEDKKKEEMKFTKCSHFQIFLKARSYSVTMYNDNSMWISCYGIRSVLPVKLKYLLRHVFTVLRCLSITVCGLVVTAFKSGQVRSGQVRSECLACTFRASCRSARLPRAQVPAFGPSYQ